MRDTGEVSRIISIALLVPMSTASEAAMSLIASLQALYRDRTARHSNRVSFIDLIFVFAVTQLSHLLLRGAIGRQSSGNLGPPGGSVIFIPLTACS